MSALRLDALVRVSQSNGRTEEDDAFRSPEQQRERIKRYIDGNGDRVVRWHEPAINVSGKTMNRQDIRETVARVKAGKTDGIIVAWLNRFSRAPVDESIAVLREVEDAGGRVIAVDFPGLGTTTATDEFTTTTMLSVNRLQWRQTQERWDTSRGDAIARGKSIGGAPFGYRYTDPTPRDSGKGVRDSRLLVDEKLRAIVVELFERKAGRATWLELARWMDTVAPKPNGGHWHRNTIRGMITNRAYLGQVRHGRHVNPTAHEPIVSASLWRRAQPEPGRTTPRGNYLLTGLARCSGCGRRMRASSGGAGSKPAVFTCITPECEDRYSTVTVDRIDAEVIKQFFEHLDTFHVQAVESGEVEEAQRAVKEAEERLRNVAAVVPTHRVAIEAHQGALREAEQDLEAAEDRLEALTASHSEQGPDVRELATDWPALGLGERRELLRAGIDAVLVRRSSSRAKKPPVSERLLVLFRGEAPDGLRDGGRGGPVRRWTWDHDVASLVPSS